MAEQSHGGWQDGPLFSAHTAGGRNGKGFSRGTYYGLKFFTGYSRNVLSCIRLLYKKLYIGRYVVRG